VTFGTAVAFDGAKYPDLKGQWLRARAPMPNPGQGPFDPTKRGGRAQEAPLTPEYQKLFEASLADQAAGGQGGWQGGYCLPVGMPGMMTIFRPMEIIVLPETTYIRIDHIRDSNRRIYTDGRDWPKDPPMGYDGYSIGKWIDTDGNLLHNEMTVIDNALTRPWTVHKKYSRDKAEFPVWPEDICPEGNGIVRIGVENYFLSGEGHLMPTRKGQEPPDLRYFKKPAQK
jgi:hypothetical protein